MLMNSLKEFAALKMARWQNICKLIRTYRLDEKKEAFSHTSETTLKAKMEFQLLFPPKFYMSINFDAKLNWIERKESKERERAEENERAPNRETVNVWRSMYLIQSNIFFFLMCFMRIWCFFGYFITLALFRYAASEQHFHVKVVRITRITHEHEKRGKKKIYHNQICAVKCYLHFSLTQLS